MAKYIWKRLCWMVPSLLAISLVTFLLMELAPSDRAIQALEQDHEVAAAADARDRAIRLRRLEQYYGLADPQTGERYSVWYRYWRWLGRAVQLDFSHAEAGGVSLRARFLDALPVTLLLNVLGLLFGLLIAVPLACRAGMQPGRVFDRTASTAFFVLNGVPEFVLATLLLLTFAGGFFDPWLPGHGLRSWQAGELSLWRSTLDLAAHLVLPVICLAIGYGVVVFRFLRESVARASASEFVRAMRGFGVDERIVRQRALRNGLVPLVTLSGTLLPSLVSGTIVVETVFSLPGLGRLGFDAVQTRDYGTVMALTMFVAVVTLFGLIMSDVLHRASDPRVELR